MIKRVALAVAVALAAGACSGLAAPSPEPTATATQAAPTQAASQAVATTIAPTSVATLGPTAAPTITFQTFGDGAFVVGKDIQPGTYRTRVASSGCYWARLKGFGGSIDDIITSAFGNAPDVITIASSDKGFKSTNCGTWTTDLSAILAPGAAIPEGTYIVGTDLPAGTYSAAASSGCYWARLKGFGGTIGDIITSDFTNASAIVTISASDKGFETNGCATWTKQ